MPLLDLLKHDKSVLDGYTIQQIVSICGDGRLKDGSKTSDELRGFLASRPPTALAEYANYCLEGNFEKGEKSGFVLQDIVNEIGRRLGYTVTNGLYQGRTNAIGFDGLWSDGENELLIEVKTSDAYRINLDTVFGYGQKLDKVGEGVDKRRCSLIVVGRQDTGDLEAQVRGSRYAWTVRMVSVEALTKLMFVNAELEDQALTAKIRKVLMPFEYTRVDHIIDLVFETQQEADSIAELEAQSATESIDSANNTSGQGARPSKRELSPTPREALDAKRFAAVSAFFSSRSLRFSRKSKTNFASDDDKVRVACAVSKRHDLDSQPYWYALHPAWVEFLNGGAEGFFLLACMDREEAFAVPMKVVSSLLDKLNVSKKEDGKMHWHVALAIDDGKLIWNVSKVGQTVDLSPYRFAITSGAVATRIG